jgi:hypothetical protein
MHWFLFLLLIVITLLIIYQDFCSRSVIWYLFPLMGVLGIINTYLHTCSWEQTFIYGIINAGFALLQFVILKLYFSLKGNGNSRLINEKIGMGDILFVFAACFFFSPVNFILFYCCSLLFAIILHLLSLKIRAKEFALTVPLAGWMAVFLIVYIITLQLSKNGLTKDDWILNYLL